MLRAGATYNQKRHTVVERDVGAGDAVGDTGTGGEHRDADLVSDITVGSSGERGRLFVSHSYGAHAVAGAVAHDLDDGSARESEQGCDALVGD